MLRPPPLRRYCWLAASDIYCRWPPPLMADIFAFALYASRHYVYC